jgi:predicted nucleic acid-binding protein
MQIVINSSPLIFLAKLSYLDKFLDYPDNFYIPRSVADEISVKSDSVSQIIQTFIGSGVLKVHAVALINLAQSLNQRLGQGESDVISLGIELNADYVLLDDLAARKEAIRLGLTIRGTLAAINRMRRDGKIVIDSLDDLYARFVEIDFRVKRSIFEQIFLDD